MASKKNKSKQKGKILEILKNKLFFFKELKKQREKKERNSVDELKKLISQQKKSPLVKTDLDAMLEVIKSKKSVHAEHLASAFGMDEEKVEELISILEENNLIQIHYPAVGTPLLKYISAEPEKKDIEKPKPKMGNREKALKNLKVLYIALVAFIGINLLLSYFPSIIIVGYTGTHTFQMFSDNSRILSYLLLALVTIPLLFILKKLKAKRKAPKAQNKKSPKKKKHKGGK